MRNAAKEAPLTGLARNNLNRAQSPPSGVETLPSSTRRPPGALSALRAARCVGLFLIVPLAEPCSADFSICCIAELHSATAGQFEALSDFARLADCKSAIQRSAAEPQPKERGVYAASTR